MVRTDSSEITTLENLGSWGAEGVLRDLIGAVPVVGGAVMGILDGIQKTRIHQMMDALATAIQRIGTDKIDRSFISTEEFLDLFFRAIRVRTRHRSQQKAQYIVGLIAESIQIDRNQRFDTDLKETFLFLVDQLSENDLRFLTDFRKGAFQGKSRSQIYEAGDTGNSVAMDDLYAKELLRDNDTWLKHIVETERGRQFNAYIDIIAAS